MRAKDQGPVSVSVHIRTVCILLITGNKSRIGADCRKIKRFVLAANKKTKALHYPCTALSTSPEIAGLVGRQTASREALEATMVPIKILLLGQY